MYTEQDLINITNQIKKRWLLLAIPCTVLLAGVVVSLVVRLEWLTSLLTILIGAALIFVYDLAIKPLRRYQQFLRNALHGRTRETDCYYQSITLDAEPVDGVLCRMITVTDHTDEGKPYERIFYWDVEREFPQLEVDQKLHVVFHDRSVVSLTVI